MGPFRVHIDSAFEADSGFALTSRHRVFFELDCFSHRVRGRLNPVADIEITRGETSQQRFM